MEALDWPRTAGRQDSGSGGQEPCQCLIHGGLRRGAGRDAHQIDTLECRQRAAVERSGQGGAAGVGDLGVAEVEPLELRQHSSRRRRRTCRRRRRRCHEGGKALVAKQVVLETEILQRGPPPQGRREGHQPRVTDGGIVQFEDLEPRQGASVQGGGELRGASVAQVHAAEFQPGYGRQRARAQPRRQPLHAVVGCGEALVPTGDCLRLAQLLAAPHAQLVAQRCGRLVISPQLRQQRLRRRPQLIAGLKATARPGSSTLHSWVKRMRCSSPLSERSAIAARGAGAITGEPRDSGPHK
eukprot:scaffold112850_cov66-Phaeocystis_antarctica.AAC.1